MKKTLLTILLCALTAFSLQAQTFQDGEWLRLRIHYGWFNASYATLEVKEEMIGDTPVYHVIGHGESTGLLDAFYKVNDTYASYIDQETLLPYKFVRNIYEGGYTKNKIIYYDQKKQLAKVKDLKHQTTKTYTTAQGVQDMISVFYYIRNQVDEQLKQPGDEVVVNMFFDEKNYKFKTVYLKSEIIKTKFGKVKCLKLRPYVQAGRIFKEQESLTVWVSADKNKIPVRISAKLAVGSITADLDAYKNLKYPFEIIYKD